MSGYRDETGDIVHKCLDDIVRVDDPKGSSRLGTR